MSLRGTRTKMLVVGSAGLMIGGLLAGCSGDGAPTASESSAASQSSSEVASEPAPTPSETPAWMVNDEDGNPVFAPVGEILPETDVEGAERAAEDFLRSYFTGLEDQSSQYMREHSVEGCVYCAAHVKEIDEISNKSQTIEILGKPVYSNFETIAPQPDQKAHIIVLDYSYPAVIAKGADGEVVDEGVAGSGSFIVAAGREDRGWEIHEVEIPDPERLQSVREFIDTLDD